MTTDNPAWKKVEQLFDEATLLPEPEREAFLRQACAGDDALYQEVMELLAYDREATGGLRENIVGAAERLVQDKDAELIGTPVGAYRITEKIADGGMGSVFLAVREDDSLSLIHI